MNERRLRIISGVFIRRFLMLLGFMSLFSLIIPRMLTLLHPTEIQTFLAASINPGWRVSTDTTNRSDRPPSAQQDYPREATPDRETLGFALTALQVILR